MKMKRLATVVFIAGAAFGLQSCSSIFGGEGGEGGFWSSSSSSSDQEYSGRRAHRPVHVTTRYHHAAGSSPVSHKDRDRQWISQQNTEDFTIEVANEEKPASVAKALHNSPKTQRSAQYKNKDGRYGGVYGSYKSREEAQAALSKMPENVRKNAKISNWGQVKPNVSTPTAAPSSTPSFSSPEPASSAAEY